MIQYMVISLTVKKPYEIVTFERTLPKGFTKLLGYHARIVGNPVFDGDFGNVGEISWAINDKRDHVLKEKLDYRYKKDYKIAFLDLEMDIQNGTVVTGYYADHLLRNLGNTQYEVRLYLKIHRP